MINVADIINDPDFAQSFVIMRDAGAWALGQWQPNVSAINSYGAIQPSSDEELAQIPEGDRVKGSIAIYTTSPIYETRPTGISDIVSWNGQSYRIVAVTPWQDTGYYKAIGARMSGQ